MDTIINPAVIYILFILAIALCRREGVTVLEAMFFPLQRSMFMSEKKFLEVYTPGGNSLLVLASIVAFIEVSFMN